MDSERVEGNHKMSDELRDKILGYVLDAKAGANPASVRDEILALCNGGGLKAYAQHRSWCRTHEGGLGYCDCGLDVYLTAASDIWHSSSVEKPPEGEGVR